MSLDFERRHRATLPNRGLDDNGVPADLDEDSLKAVLNSVLLDIANRLFKCNRTIGMFVELPQPKEYVEHEAYEQNLYEREIGRYNTDEFAEEVLDYERVGGPLSLNEDQRRIYDSVVESLNLNDQQQEIPNNLQRANNLYFVDGPGGCGKTHLYKALLAYCRSKNAIALACASSGIAATLLPDGSTAHSMFKLPLDITEDSVCKVKAQFLLAKLLRGDASLIISDEAPRIMHRFSFEAVDRLFKELRSNYRLLFGGDFRQTLPVVVKNDDSESASSSTARGGNQPVEYLNTLKPSGMPPHKLTLKRFQPIICLRNLSPQDGLCNGTRLIVRNVSRYMIEAEIAVGDFTRTIQHIPRIVLHTDDNGTLPFTLKRKQILVQPAFGMTVNKSQG